MFVEISIFTEVGSSLNSVQGPHLNDQLILTINNLIKGLYSF